MDKLILQWHIADPCVFWLKVGGLTVAMRVWVFGLHWLETHLTSGWRSQFARDLLSRRAISVSILGTIELATFPVLMAVGAWEAIGAYIGLKTIAQWHHWKEDRAPFNRYLVGNALVLILSLLCLEPHVVLSTCAAGAGT
ncbi:MAG TPA: hypothetical protein VMF53_04780 [Alphaproteobacteria bacterium]|nr:hypothetical protein [Alphaproteobacteria bacterium]